MTLQSITKGALPQSTDINQVIKTLLGQVDSGQLSLAEPTASPSVAPSVTLSSGSLSGQYQWGTYWITGIVSSSGTVSVTGRTTPSPYTSAQSITSQQGTISIAGQTVPTPVIGWGVVRNANVIPLSSALTLSAVSNASSTLAATKYFINVAFGNSNGTTTPGSSEANITLATANAYNIQFSVTLPGGATYALVGMGTASGSEAQYAQVNSSATVTYVGSNTAGVSASVNGSTLTITISKPISDTSHAMPTVNTASTGFYEVPGSEQFANTNGNIPMTYIDNTSDANLVTAAPSSNTTGTTLLNNTNPNLLFNPTGALGLSGWTAAGTSLTWQTLFGQQGSYFYVSGTVAANTWAQLASSQIPVSAGQTITLSGIVDGLTLTSGSAYASIYAFNSGGTQLGEYDSNRVSAGQTNVPVSVTATLPANAAYVKVYLQYGSGSASTAGSARWWNMKLEQGSMATTFNDVSTLNTTQYASVLPFLQLIGGSNFKVQTGSLSVSATANTVVSSGSISFPTPFSSGCSPLVLLTVRSLGSSNVQTTAWMSNIPSNTSFGVSVESAATQSVTVAWLAIGY